MDLPRFRNALRFAVCAVAVGCARSQLAELPRDDVAHPRPIGHTRGDAAVGSGADAAAPEVGDGDSAPRCASAADVQWGTALDDSANAVLVSADGVIVAGFEGGTLGVLDDGAVGNGVGWVRLLDGAGGTSWEARFDTSDMDSVEALAWAPASSRLYAVGRTRGSLAAQSQGKWDAFAASIDPRTGTSSAVVQFGDERPQHPTAVSANGGALVLAGYDEIYIEGNAVLDDENPFTARVSEGISLVSWTKERTLHADAALAVLSFADGSALIGGRGGDSPGAWIRSLSADGGVAWEERVTSFFFDSVTAILRDDGDGLLRLVGTRPSGSSSEPFVMAFDLARRQIVWTKSFDPPIAGPSYTLAAASVPGGGLVLVGETYGSFDPEGRAPADDLDAFALRVATDGAVVGAWQRGSAGDDVAQAVAVDACGGVFVAGTTTGDLLSPSKGRQDAFLVRAALR